MKGNNSNKSRCSFGLSSLDLVGGKFSFEFPTLSRKLQTKVGSCLTFIIGLVAVLAMTLIGSKYFDTSSPSITFSNEVGPEVTHNLARELLVPPMTVYMEGAPIQPDVSKYATFKAIFLQNAFDPVKGRLTRLAFVVIDYVNCKTLNDAYYNRFLSKIDDKNHFKQSLLCPDFKGNYSNSEIFPNFETLEYKLFFVRIYPCSREDSSECLPSNSVNKLKVVVARAKKTIVPSNYTHPYQTTVSMEEMSIDPFRWKSFQYESKVTKIVDLRNEIFGEKDRGQFISTDLFLQDSSPRDGSKTTCLNVQGAAFAISCRDYISMVHRAGTEVIRVKRQYNSPVQIIGEIGGVLKVALMFAMVYPIYLQMRKRRFITEKIFSTKKLKTPHPQRAKILNQEEEQVSEKEEFKRLGRVKVAPKPNRTKADHQYSNKVKEECFRSKTCFPNLQKNLNLVHLLEKITFNEFSKKMLPQAIFIKRMVLKSPQRREQFEAHKKRFMSRLRQKEQQKNHLSGQQDEREGEEEKESEQGELYSPATIFGMNTKSKETFNSDLIKKGLKLFLQKQLRMNNPPKNASKRLIRAKRQPRSRASNPEPEIISKIPIAEKVESKEITEPNPSLRMKKATDQGFKQSQSSREGSPSKKSSFEKNSEALQLSAFGTRPRVASLHLGRQKGGSNRKLFSWKKSSVKSKFGSFRQNQSKDGSKK